MAQEELSQIGLIGLGTMGQNLAMNIAEKGFKISVYNRSYEKTEATLKLAHENPVTRPNLRGFKDINDFVKSIAKPRPVIILVTAGKAVDETIAKMHETLEAGDIIIDGGNEWYVNTERRSAEAAEKKLLYLGMGVSGGEEGARYGPSLMPGGAKDAYLRIEPILKKIAAQVDSGPCVTYVGPGGAGNYVKMIHNGIEYGDMQLIAETYDILKNVGKLTNEEIGQTFDAWNKGELKSYLIEITAEIFKVKDEDGKSYIVDAIKDKTGSKGTGKWTVQEAAEQAVPCPTMSAALDGRYLSALLDERAAASKILTGPSGGQDVDKKQLVSDLSDALYAAKICSYAQGMNLIKAQGKNKNWGLDLGDISRIWKGGCIIRAVFLDRIKQAYDRNPELANLMVDTEFAKEMNAKQASLRKVNILGINAGVSLPAFSASLAYFDSYRRARLPANLTQAQRDFFGAHTYERLDKPGPFHTEWAQLAAKATTA